MVANRSTQFHLTAVFIAAASLLFAACSSTSTEATIDNEPTPEDRASEPDTSRVVATWDDPGENEIQLLVSNQSSVDMTADLTFEMDGVLILSETFETGDFHNFFAYNINGVENGEHTLTIRSDDGHEQLVRFEKTGDPAWIVIHYWPEESSTGFIKSFENEPVEFA